MDLPRIERANGRARLIVDGRPFLILGVQWDCDSCFSPEEMNPLFSHAARMEANTAALPTYWREVEPEPGRFDFRMVDERIKQAQAHGLRIVLLWFATWKNACAFYAPAYVRDDPATYPLAVDRDGQPTISPCPSAETTWERDCAALTALMAHLRDHDLDRTVIMVQIENEAGLLGTDRCYCAVCNERFVAEGWASTRGDSPAEVFSVAGIASYIDRLAKQAKAVYSLPVYTNVWLSRPVGSVPGRDYPSGGAVPQVLSLFRERAPHLDLIAPDIYVGGQRDFQRLCCDYRAGGNPLFIAEHSSSPIGRAERNVFYAIGQHGAIGFDPWAIDSPHPQRYGPPLVDPVDGAWGPQAFSLRDSYRAISRAVAPLVAAQGTDRLFTFVQEPAEESTGWEADGCDVLIAYHDREGAGRGIVIQQGPTELVALGLGFDVRFRRPRPDGRPRPVVSAEWGRYDGDRWVLLHPMRRERPESAGIQVDFLEPGVARVVLAE
jgi:hypothetical protein